METMALSAPQNICIIIQNTTRYAIIADESVFIRWVDDELVAQEEFIDIKLAEWRRYCKNSTYENLGYVPQNMTVDVNIMAGQA